MAYIAKATIVPTWPITEPVILSRAPGAMALIISRKPRPSRGTARAVTLTWASMVVTSLRVSLRSSSVSVRLRRELTIWPPARLDSTTVVTRTTSSREGSRSASSPSASSREWPMLSWSATLRSSSPAGLSNSSAAMASAVRIASPAWVALARTRVSSGSWPMNASVRFTRCQLRNALPPHRPTSAARKPKNGAKTAPTTK